MSVDHYENFPVASILLPARLRGPVRDIYRFARSADDVADEGDAPARERLDKLAGYRQALERIGAGSPDLPAQDPRSAIFTPLGRTIARFSLPLAPFFDLLSAFEQDVTTHRYPDEPALLDYCRRSANPVGRLMLHLYGAASPQNLAWSDAICTGLQLVNFWQDIAVDWRKARVYLPQDALARHGIDERFIAENARPAQTGAGAKPPAAWDETGAAWRALMRARAGRARELLVSGLPLARRLPLRPGFELALVVQGGLRILERLDQLHYDMFRRRPTLGKRDWALMLWRAVRPGRESTRINPDPGKT